MRKNSLIQDDRRYEFSWGNGKKIVIDDENQMIFFWGNGSNWKIIDKVRKNILSTYNMY